jgi:phage recombination protein Bet
MSEIVRKSGVADTQALANLARVCEVTPGEVAKILSEMVMPGASGPEIVAFALVCAELRLSPLKNEVYAFKGQNGQFRAMIGIDGWLTSINRQPDFDGIEIDMVDNPQTGKPHHCTVKIHHKKRAHPVVVTEYFDECRRSTKPWDQHPRRMLRHKTIAQAARIAFGFAGITDSDDADDLPSVPATGQMRAAAMASPADRLNARIAELPPPTVAAVVSAATAEDEEPAAEEAEVVDSFSWGACEGDPDRVALISEATAKKLRTTGKMIVSIVGDDGFDGFRATAQTGDDLTPAIGRTCDVWLSESPSGLVVTGIRSQ